MDQPAKNLDFTQLTVDERLELLERIWDSLEDEDRFPELTNAQKEELRRRIEHHEQHPGDFLSWDEVKSQIRAKSSK